MSLEDRSGRIDRARPVLLYEQVAADLRADVMSRRITGMLPGEFELADQYGVSRVTVRSAIELLMAEGLLIRLRGRGTYVAEQA